jgi:hypothetical protein
VCSSSHNWWMLGMLLTKIRRDGSCARWLVFSDAL